MTVNKVETIMQAPIFYSDGRVETEDTNISVNYKLLGTSNFFTLIKFYKLPYDKLNDEFQAFIIHHLPFITKKNYFFFLSSAG